MAMLIGKYTERIPVLADADSAAADSSSIRPGARDLTLELSFAQRRMWFLNQLEPASPDYNQIKALRLRGRLNREALQKALGTIVERHDAFANDLRVRR
jgi:Condensation domain